MGFNPKAPDRYSMDDWRDSAPTAKAMLTLRWTVESECQLCSIRLRVNPAVTVRVMGPEFRFWGAVSSCKRVGCPGTAVFYGKPPKLGRFILLSPKLPPGQVWQPRERTRRRPDGPSGDYVPNYVAGMTFEAPKPTR